MMCRLGVGADFHGDPGHGDVVRGVGPAAEDDAVDEGHDGAADKCCCGAALVVFAIQVNLVASAEPPSSAKRPLQEETKPSGFDTLSNP